MEYQEIEIKDFDIRDFYSSFIFYYPKPVWHTTDGDLAFECDCHKGRYVFMWAKVLPSDKEHIHIFVNVYKPETLKIFNKFSVVIFGDKKEVPKCPDVAIELRIAKDKIKDKMDYIILEIRKAQSKEWELL